MHHVLFSAITYKVVIKTGKQLGGSTTTAQVWMTLAGSITDTGVMNIPRNENEFRFQVKNALNLDFNVFSTKVPFEDTIFTSPTGDGTAILRGHPSHAKAGHRWYLHFSVILRP